MLRSFEASYPGDTRYTAAVDRTGNMTIVEQPDGDARSIPAKAAKRIIDDLENAASSARAYDDSRVEAVRHFILARAFERTA